MGKKNTVRMNKMPKETEKSFDVAFKGSDKVERVEVIATRIEADYETLKVYMHDQVVGEFRDWLYYVRLDDIDDDTECEVNHPAKFKEFDNK